MKVNDCAQALITKYMFPLLRKSPSASVIFTSSGVGRQGREFWVHMLSQNLLLKA